MSSINQYPYPSHTHEIHTTPSPSLRKQSDVTLNLAELGYGIGLRNALLPLMRNTLPGWDDVTDESHIHVHRVSGAFTNCVFFVTKTIEKTKPQKVVLRIYGNGIDQMFEREKELEWLKMLSTVNIGPQLLATFKNGRFEQFLDATTLTKDELRMAPISRHIASRMFQLHNMVKIFPPKHNAVPEVWVNIDRWYPLACKAFRSSLSGNEEASRLLNLLRDEIPRLKLMLSKINSPIVFAHNDTQYGNILRLSDGSNELVVVDFEYAGYNYRGFDLGNHFCEWTFNYGSPDPHVLHRDWYPGEEEQLNFLRAYLETQNLEYGLSPSKNQLLLQKMRVECNAFALASHVMWGTWGLVQASQSEITFDYLSYGIQRLNAFKDLKEDIYKQIEHYYID